MGVCICVFQIHLKSLKLHHGHTDPWLLVGGKDEERGVPLSCCVVCSSQPPTQSNRGPGRSWCMRALREGCGELSSAQTGNAFTWPTLPAPSQLCHKKASVSEAETARTARVDLPGANEAWLRPPSLAKVLGPVCVWLLLYTCFLNARNPHRKL